MTDQIDAVVDGVAGRLRDLRQRRGRTLAEIAAATGISVSTLSRLESGLRRPTLDLLIRLASTYGASLDDLVGAPQIADPRVQPRTLYRDGTAIIPLTRNNPDIIAFKMVLPPHAPTAPIPRKVHAGYDWIYILTGSVRLAIGETETVLTAGETAEFDTRLPHGVVSAGNDRAEIISLLSRQGERAHLPGGLADDPGEG